METFKQKVNYRVEEGCDEFCEDCVYHRVTRPYHDFQYYCLYGAPNFVFKIRSHGTCNVFKKIK